MQRSSTCLALLAVLGLCSCLTVTNERPSYAELDAAEKAAVDVVLGELTGFDGQLRATCGRTIKDILSKEQIDVSFEGQIISLNLGDNIVHVAPWENLTAAQHTLVQGWFQATAVQAEQTYKKLFYQFLAVGQGVKQFMYQELGRGTRSVNALERDSARVAVAYYDGVGRGSEMRGFLTAACRPVIAQHDATYTARFANAAEYLKNPLNALELANPEAPTGYIYFLCRWIGMAVGPGPDIAEDLRRELDWLVGLRNAKCTPISNH